MEQEGLIWMLLCFFKLQYVKFYHLRNAIDYRHELDFELRQRMNARGRRFVGSHNLEMSIILPRDCDMFCQAVQDVWVDCKRARALGILTLVIFLYMTVKGQAGASMKCDLSQRIAEDVYHTMSLGAFLHCAWYGSIEGLAYPRMVYSCDGGSALLYVSLGSIKLWYAVGIRRLIRDMAMDQVLV